MEGLQRDVILVFGKTGSGKSEWIKHFLRSCNRTIIVDADQQGYSALHFGTYDDLAAYLEKNHRPGGFFRVSYTPYEDEFPLMLGLAHLCSPVHLVLEEADRFPDPAECFEYQHVIVRGRHSATSLIAASLYPAIMPKMLRSQATRVIAFRQHEPADVEWLRRVMGDDAYELPNLADHEFLDWKQSSTEKLTPQKLFLTNDKKINTVRKT